MESLSTHSTGGGSTKASAVLYTPFCLLDVPHREITSQSPQLRVHRCVFPVLPSIPSTGAAKGTFPLIWTMTLRHKISVNCLSFSGLFILSVQNQGTANWWFMVELTGTVTHLLITLVCLQGLWVCWRHPAFRWVNLGEMNLIPGNNFCCHLLPSSANISSERCAVTCEETCSSGWSSSSEMNIVKCQWLCPWTCGQLVRVTIRPGLGWKTTSLSAQLASTHRNSLTDRSQGLLWNPQQSFLYTCRKFAYQSKAQRSGGQINMKDNQTKTTLQRDMNSTIVLGNTHLLWLL